MSITIETQALDLWVPLLEGDHALARSEIEKMAIYKGYGAELGAVVTLEDVRVLAAGGQNVSIDDIIMSWENKYGCNSTKPSAPFRAIDRSQCKYSTWGYARKRDQGPAPTCLQNARTRLLRTSQALASLNVTARLITKS